MIDRKKTMTREEMLDAVRKCDSSDFDGHVDWENLSFEKQLLWISQSGRLFLEWGRPDPE